MKNLIGIFLAATLVVGAIVNIGFMSKSNKLLSSIGMDNVIALADDEGLPVGYVACLNAGGNYNMASVSDGSGFETAECKISGKICAFGMELSGAYEKGKKYNIPWCRYKCITQELNCCMKQGLYTGDIKLA